MTQNMVAGILVAMIGLMLCTDPRGVWKVTERWKTAAAAEASPLFMIIARVVGGALAAVGLLVALGVIH